MAVHPGLIRLCAAILTATVCVVVGAVAGPVAVAAELQWPLSEINFRDSVRMGVGWGVAGAFIAVFALSLVDRKHLFAASIIAVLATWFISCTGIWLWLVVTSFG